MFAQAKSNAGEQLGDAEGLDHVVVRAGVQSLHGVRDTVAGREDDDGGAEPVGTGLTQQRQAIDVRQTDVEEHEVDVGDGRQDGACTGAVHRLERGVLGATECFDQDRTDEIVILHDENIRHVTLLLRLRSIARQNPARTVRSNRVLTSAPAGWADRWFPGAFFAARPGSRRARRCRKSRRRPGR